MKKTVLIVHADEGVQTALRNCFDDENYKVVCINDGMEAMEITEDHEFNFVLSGVKLPGIDGFSVCRHIRKKYDSCIILIEKNMGEQERLIGFEVGADDCIVMPEDANIVLLKMEALLSRIRGVAPGNSKDIISDGGIEINNKAHSVTVNGEMVDLAAKEYGVLFFADGEQRESVDS